MERSAGVSVIIPTRNESAWLKANLEILSTLRQVCEIIVADAHSSDDTVEIAKRYGCIVTSGGTPAVGRNTGRKASKSEILLFLDADTYIDESALVNSVLALTESANLAAVTLRVRPLSRRFIDHLAYWIAFVYLRSLNSMGVGQGLGNAILIKADAFDAIGGFSEDIVVGEDADLLFRLRVSGRAIRLLGSKVVWTSPRRFRLEGRTRFFSKVIVWSALRLVGSKLSLFPYIWRTYPSNWAASDLRELHKKWKGNG